jgi:predicted RNA binding protein YcfA (HicA-like mRNA interferase family)
VERLPRVTPNEVLRALHRDGWVVGREGKHTILEHLARPGNVVIPRHRRTLKLKTLDAILKAAGLSRQEFRRLL